MAPGTATLAWHPDLSSESHPKPQCPTRSGRCLYLPPGLEGWLGIQRPPTAGKEGRVLPLRPGTMQWLSSSPGILLAMGSLCLPAPAGTVLGSHRGRIWLGCWRLILTLLEPQSSQGSQCDGGRGETGTMGTWAWAWGSAGHLQHAGRSPEEQSSPNKVILQPKILPLKPSQCQLVFCVFMGCPAHLWCGRNSNSCTLGWRGPFRLGLRCARREAQTSSCPEATTAPSLGDEPDLSSAEHHLPPGMSSAVLHPAYAIGPVPIAIAWNSILLNSVLLSIKTW